MMVIKYVSMELLILYVLILLLFLNFAQWKCAAPRWRVEHSANYVWLLAHLPKHVPKIELADWLYTAGVNSRQTVKKIWVLTGFNGISWSSADDWTTCCIIFALWRRSWMFGGLNLNYPSKETWLRDPEPASHWRICWTGCSLLFFHDSGCLEFF